MPLKNNSRFLTLAEVLKKINDDTNLLETDFKYSPGSPLEKIFNYAFNEKWDLPEGDPPFTPSRFAEGQTDDLLILIRKGRLDYFSEKRYPQISKRKREELFIRTLESVHKKESEVILWIKDQCLTEHFPNITRKLLEKYNYLPKTLDEEVEEEKEDTFREEVKKPKKKTSSKTKSKKKTS